MFNKLFFFCAAILAQCCLLMGNNGQSGSGIRWFTNYDEALKQAKSSSQPMLLFFTGSDWCGWCSKLDEEAFNTKEFADAASNKFVFVKIDYPLYSAQDPQIKTQNKQLQQKFSVRSFPTVILFDAQQNQQIGQTGYKAGGGKQYASHLSKMLSDYSSYKQKVSALDNAKFSGSDLKEMHEKAKELGLKTDASKIVQLGIASEQSLFFLTERYRSLSSEGQIQGSEAVAIKQQLLAADPKNDRQIPYQLAVIEFERYCEEREKNNFSADLIVTPLVSYIQNYGGHDKDNLWRLQMIISQVYLDSNQMSKALKYAQQSYESAPSSAQPEIALAIQNIKCLVPPPHTFSKK